MCPCERDMICLLNHHLCCVHFHSHNFEMMMMKSLYRNTISIACLLICLFTTSATAHSFIRQFTDDHNTNLQQEVGAEAIQNLDVGHYSHKNKEIPSRENYVPVTLMRARPPSSYYLKIESFNTLFTATNAEKYESHPFTVGGYNWTFVVYPNGNKLHGGSGHLGLYVSIDNSTFDAAHKEIYTDLRFYIFNNKQRMYYTIQARELLKFDAFNTIWGFPTVFPTATFRNPASGYLFYGDRCEFGVDVNIHTLYQRSEIFSVTRNFRNPRFTWNFRGFSTLLKESYLSDVFSIGGRSWNIKVYPNGRDLAEGKALSMYLILNEKEKFRPYENIYVRAKLRVLNQRNRNNIERQINNMYRGAGYEEEYSWGFNEFISLSDLRDTSRGFVVNDVLMVQVEMEAISSTKYLPS